MVVYAQDEQALLTDEQIMFGPRYLACPVLSTGRKYHQVYLPKGVWMEKWRARKSHCVTKGYFVRYNVSLNDIPYFELIGNAAQNDTPYFKFLQ